MSRIYREPIVSFCLFWVWQLIVPQDRFRGWMRYISYGILSVSRKDKPDGGSAYLEDIMRVAGLVTPVIRIAPMVARALRAGNAAKTIVK